MAADTSPDPARPPSPPPRYCSEPECERQDASASHAGSVEAPSSCTLSGLSEKAALADDAYEHTFPDGGRGWLVVLGCFIYSAATVGWGCVRSGVPSSRAR